jgi:hypothetical protein
MFDTPEVGEILQAAMPKLKAHFNDICQQQYDMCMKKGFHLKKYYIWILYYKNNHTGKLVLRPAICRSTRPSPYQDEDMLLWSVTNYDHIKFEWAIPKKETLNYILANPDKFDKDHVKMLRDYCNDKIDRIEHYSSNGKVA